MQNVLLKQIRTL